MPIRMRGLMGTGLAGLVLGLVALASCHAAPEGNASTGATPTAATAARTPPDKPSEEAEHPQIRMARDEGKAYQASLAYMVKHVAAGGGASQHAGDYIVAYAEEKAEGLYTFRNGRLEWQEPHAENAHLEVSVSDAGDGRFIPYLKIAATLVGPDGRTLGPFDMPFVWHPGLYHYGRNIVTPGDGAYEVRIHIAPPEFQRHDQENGRRYARPVDVTFRNAAFKTGHG